MTGFPGDRRSTLAPAKVNLTLRILGRRSDGYHDLESVVVKVTLYDGIDVLPADEGGLTLNCSDPSIPTDGRNTIRQAVQALAAEIGQAPQLLIQVHKRIPVAAGLGGGSSDAAAVLRLLNDHWQVGLDARSLSSLGARIGSDVPLFLQPSTVFMQGRGEIVETVALSWAGWMVLVMPGYPVASGHVYRQWCREQRRHRADARSCLERSCRTAADLDEVLFNDLADSIDIVEPRLRGLQANLEERTDRKFHITGSGSTLFACADDYESARQLQERAAHRLEYRTQLARVITTDDSK